MANPNIGSIYINIGSIYINMVAYIFNSKSKYEFSCKFKSRLGSICIMYFDPLYQDKVYQLVNYFGFTATPDVLVF